MQLPTALRTLAALSLIAGAQAAPDSLNKTYDWGSSTFGLKATSSATVRVNNADNLTSSGEISFKAKLFGGSRTFRGDLLGTFGSGVKKATGTFEGTNFNGNSYSFSRTKDFHGVGERDIEVFSSTLVEVEKTFTVWGVPCIIIADVTSSGHIGYERSMEAAMANLYSLPEFSWVHSVYTSLAAHGRITAGPGTGLAGLGAFGRVKFGELRLELCHKGDDGSSVIRKRFARLLLSRGDFEIGVRAWFAGIEEEAVLMTREGSTDVLKKVNF